MVAEKELAGRILRLKDAELRGSKIARSSLNLMKKEMGLKNENNLQSAIENYQQFLRTDLSNEMDGLEQNFEEFSSICRFYSKKIIPTQSLDTLIQILDDETRYMDLYALKSTSEIISELVLNPLISKKSISKLLSTTHAFGSFVSGYEGDAPYHLIQVANNPMHSSSTYSKLVEKNNSAYGLALLKNPSVSWDILNKIDFSSLTYSIVISGGDATEIFPNLGKHISKTNVTKSEGFGLDFIEAIDNSNGNFLSINFFHLMLLFQRVCADLQDKKISIQKLKKFNNTYVNLSISLIPNTEYSSKEEGISFTVSKDLRNLAAQIYARKIWNPFD